MPTPEMSSNNTKPETEMLSRVNTLLSNLTVPPELSNTPLTSTMDSTLLSRRSDTLLTHKFTDTVVLDSVALTEDTEVSVDSEEATANTKNFHPCQILSMRS